MWTRSTALWPCESCQITQTTPHQRTRREEAGAAKLKRIYIEEESAEWRPEERMIEEENEVDARLQAISAAIRVVPHFPKPGIMFKDITPLLLRPKVFKDAVELFVDRYRNMEISAVAGIEARGFIFGSSLALAIGAKFIPLQKPKKLPGEVFSEAYELEYGKDCLEMHVGAVQPRERVLIFDDLIATGGTLCAAMKLIEKAGGEVVECACLVGSPKFKGRYRLKGKPVYVLVECRR